MALGLEGISKSEVSRICARLDEQVQVFRGRPLAGRYPGRATYSFEDTIRYDSNSLPYQSLYVEFKRFARCIDRKHLKIVVFEDFLRNWDVVLRDPCLILGPTRSFCRKVRSRVIETKRALAGMWA